jgi:hypothetical protein
MESGIASWTIDHVSYQRLYFFVGCSLEMALGRFETHPISSLSRLVKARAVIEGIALGKSK